MITETVGLSTVLGVGAAIRQTGQVASDRDILDRVNELISQENELRDKLQHREIDESEEHRRLQSIEVQLDQCWDLLRQRRALRNSGGDPRDAQVRPAGEVEGYLG
ncbi:putative protein [Mycolicibacterium vanbaalenii]|uniref:DUF2630 domain-containing protein n=1 Tax=Mycolicibacterium vanbaalenii TaxID=110539 RepID=A0A5S9QBZ2_MYCVN|nr:putative protein [Mycolicibacterium vanbaalenii]